MAGSGTGFGQADVIGASNRVATNSRAERQQQFKDRQYKIMETEQAKQQQMQQQQPADDIVAKVQAQEQEIATLKKKRNGAVSSAAMANAATAVGGPNVASDFVKHVNNSPELQESLKVKPHQMSAFDANSRADNDSFLRYLDKSKVDYTAWSPEYLQTVKDSYANSGLFYNFQGDVVDGSSLIQATGAMNMVGTEGTNIFEGKKANLGAMLDGEEGYAKWIGEQSKDPDKKSWFQDYVDKLPKSERDALMKRKAAISKQTDEQNTADIDSMKSSLETTPLPEESTPLGEPILDTNGNNIATSYTAPDGSKVAVSEEQDGTQVAVTEDGTSVVKNGNTGGVATQPDGTVTTFDGEQTITITPNGQVVTDYKLPVHVQMAYDMLGMKSSYSEDAVNARSPKDRNQNFEQFLTGELKANNITKSEYMTQLKEYKNLKGSASAPSDWKSFYANWQNEPANKDRNIAEARKDFKAAGEESKLLLERRVDYLLTQPDANTGELYTKERALEKVQNTMRGGKAAQYGELTAMAAGTPDPEKKRQLLEVRDSLAAGVTEQARQRKVSEITSAQEYAEDIPLHKAVSAYSGATAATPEASVARRKSKELENAINFSTQDKADLAEFRGEVRNYREFGRAKNAIEELVASGEYKSGPMDTAAKQLVSYFPKDVNDFLEAGDWYKSARADKGIDSALVNYVRQVSGLTVSDREFKNLKKILGDDYASEEARLADLKSFHRRLEDEVQLMEIAYASEATLTPYLES